LKCAIVEQVAVTNAIDK